MTDPAGSLLLALTGDLELWHAWKLLQQLYEIYDADIEAEAARRIESFVHAWAKAPIPEFRTVLHPCPVGCRRSGLPPV